MEQEGSNKRSWLKVILVILGALLLVGSVVAGLVYYTVFGDTIDLEEEVIVTIPSETSVSALAEILTYHGVLQSTSGFVFTANQMNYEVKPGKYKIPTTVHSLYELIRKLRGSQLAIRITFHNFRIKEQLAGYLSRKTEIDSFQFAQLLNDTSFLRPYGYTPQTIMALFIPNTYEIYWDCTAKKFMDRMVKEHRRFWNEDRLAKAVELELSPTEVYTLASIVECESQYKPERPRIAGVYLNRLQKEGWKLEADPTVVFAVGDFSLKRVLNRHLEVESPYNTYKYAGLPPGPIYMASIDAIDAVLDAEKHDYMFFCANPHEEGAPKTHAFAKTFRQHQRNARKYWRWMRQNN